MADKDVSDEIIIATFQATGCPNSNPNWDWWKTWKTQDTHTVLKDMFNHCALANANPRSLNVVERRSKRIKNLLEKRRNRKKRRINCCGNIKCKVASCTQQSKFITGIKIYLAAHLIY